MLSAEFANIIEVCNTACQVSLYMPPGNITQATICVFLFFTRGRPDFKVGCHGRIWGLAVCQVHPAWQEEVELGPTLCEKPGFEPLIDAELGLTFLYNPPDFWWGHLPCPTQHTAAMGGPRRQRRAPLLRCFVSSEASLMTSIEMNLPNLLTAGCRMEFGLHAAAAARIGSVLGDSSCIFL